ncbi:hypothetical protein ACHAW6_012665 [Cyclotella cf. meneghiniana]
MDDPFASMNRYTDLTCAIHYTDKPPPDFVDRFHDVCQMIDTFNQHYAEEYIPSWLINELMAQQVLPGVMSVPRKPHPLGNKYPIADGDDGKPFMWRIKIQEGKDLPKDATGKWAFPSIFEGTNAANGCKFSKTTALMCEMTVPIYGTGKMESMDSGFCVTAGILHLHELGIYGQALIKKHKYWPKDIPGNQINWYFDEKEPEFSKTLKQDMDGISFYVHCSKDTKFFTKMMSARGLLMPVPDHKTYHQNEVGQWVSFNYPDFSLATTTASIRWMTLTIGIMIPLVWSRFGTQSGVPLGNSHSFAQLLRPMLLQLPSPSKQCICNPSTSFSVNWQCRCWKIG